MARPRSKKMAGFPDYVYRSRKHYVLRAPGETQVKLCPITATRTEVWNAYLSAPRIPRQAVVLTLRGLLDQYLASAQFAELAEGTRYDARKAFRMLCRTPTKAGTPFGDTPMPAVTVVVMRRYMDKRGETAKKRANTELSYLSTACAWAIERGIIAMNPCSGVRKFRLKARDRYVEDHEYDERYALAGELGMPDMQVAMELAYLCRLREVEIVQIRDTPQFLQRAGMLAQRAKGSKTQIIRWSDRLRAAINLARSIPHAPGVTTLLVSPHTGRPLPVGTLRGHWQALRREAHARGQAVDWTFHDLKAKGVSDAAGDKHQASGHKSPRMTAVYDRRPGEVDSTQ